MWFSATRNAARSVLGKWQGKPSNSLTNWRAAGPDARGNSFEGGQWTTLHIKNLIGIVAIVLYSKAEIAELEVGFRLAELEIIVKDMFIQLRSSVGRRVVLLSDLQ
jgi:hypothetical protein